MVVNEIRLFKGPEAATTACTHTARAETIEFDKEVVLVTIVFLLVAVREGTKSAKKVAEDATNLRPTAAEETISSYKEVNEETTYSKRTANKDATKSYKKAAKETIHFQPAGEVVRTKSSRKAEEDATI